MVAGGWFLVVVAGVVVSGRHCLRCSLMVAGGDRYWGLAVVVAGGCWRCFFSGGCSSRRSLLMVVHDGPW